MRFLFLEPFFGGSHEDFARGLCRHSKHDIDLVTLPARFWKWRMRGAALHFVRRTAPLTDYDGLITTDLMSLADFRALSGASCPPSLVYFHENQLTYPLAPGEAMDFQFGFTDITTALAAEKVIFNSETHFSAFFSGLPGFLRMMPEYAPRWVVAEIRQKARVLYPGCQFPAEREAWPHSKMSPPLIIWNHRWEFDKDPEAFFDALGGLKKRDLDFRLALMGENFQDVPKAFIAARDRYKDQIVQFGYVKSKESYRNWLKQGSIVISTALQENFGISVVEAIRFGCLPLLPNRLSYPEILPTAFHSDFLYENNKDLMGKLCVMVRNFSPYNQKADALSQKMGAFAWENRIYDYDEALEDLGTQGHG